MIFLIKFYDISRYINSLLSYFKSFTNFIYVDKNIYVYTEKKTRNDILKEIKKLVNLEDGDILIAEIRIDDIPYQHELAKEWIKNILNQQEIIKKMKEIEDKNKESLKSYSDMLDFLDAELEKQIENKKLIQKGAI